MKIARVLVGLIPLLWCSCQPDSGPASPGILRYDAALKENPRDLSALYMRGYLAAQLGDARTARKCFNEAIRLAPDDAYQRRGYGWALYLLKDYSGALKQWQIRADLTDYKAYDVYYTLAIGKWKTGKKREALALYQKAVERDSRFGAKQDLLERTDYWHAEEQEALIEMFSRWHYHYGPRTTSPAPTTEP
ncbi:MAG: tetratricopeptide repeat protein [Candidatus Methylacidiphilales bacterium]